MTLTNMHSDSMSNASAGQCITVGSGEKVPMGGAPYKYAKGCGCFLKCLLFSVTVT